MDKENYISPVVEVIGLEHENIITNSTEIIQHKTRNSGTLKFGSGWWYTGEGDSVDQSSLDEDY